MEVQNEKADAKEKAAIVHVTFHMDRDGNIYRDFEPRTFYGLGQTTLSTQSIASIAAQGAATTGGILAGLSSLGALAPEFALAGPIGAAIAGLTALGIGIANIFSGCGETCIETTAIVNQLGPVLQNNLNTYLAAPIHYASMQAAALNNFDTVWAALVKACSNAAYGSAGVACISDRQQGGCKWQTSPGGWSQASGTWQYTPAGANGTGSTCWNYFVGFRDPIANDPTVVPDPTPASFTSTGAGTATGSGSGFSFPVPLLVGGGLLLLLAMANQ